MQLTLEMLQEQRSIYVRERDGFLGQATAVEGAIKALDHLINVAQMEEKTPETPDAKTEE